MMSFTYFNMLFITLLYKLIIKECHFLFVSLGYKTMSCKYIFIDFIFNNFAIRKVCKKQVFDRLK